MLKASAPPRRTFGRTTRLRASSRAAWTLLRPFWLAPEQAAARRLLALLLAAKLAIIGLCVAQNHWYGAFYSTLQDRDASGFWRQIGVFAAIAIGYAGALASSTWITGQLKARWRAALAAALTSAWLEGAYWRSRFDGESLDHPEQRVTADADAFVSLTLDLAIGALDVGTSLAAFTFVLAGLSGTLSLGPVALPGYMVIAAYAFTLVSSVVIHRLGRPLAGLYATLSGREASMRAAVARVAEHAESIAFHRGEGRERAEITTRIAALRDAALSGLSRERALNLFGAGHHQAAIVLPFLLAAPRFFSGEMNFGEVMQVVAAFASVAACLNYFIHSYGQIAHWSAATARVAAFQRAIGAPPPACGLTREPDEALVIAGLRLDGPDGRSIAQGLDFEAQAGEALLIRGASGAGKSTLLRALAGLWPFAQGRVGLARDEAMFLPQKPYVPPGSLKAAACYPLAPDTIEDEVVANALTEVGLPGLALMLHEDAAWASILSGGEQQRLAFARVLIARPKLVFLDEATSALDEPMERRLYELLRDAPWPKTVVSVGHRSTLLDLHDRTIELGPEGIAAEKRRRRPKAKRRSAPSLAALSERRALVRR